MSPSDFPKLSEAYMKLVKFMTWRRFAATVITLLTCISMWTMFENRQMIYKGIVTNASSVRTMIEAPLSQTTVDNVNSLLKRVPNLVAVQFVSVDFRTNSRKTEYFKSNDANMDRQMHEYIANMVTATPFFTDNTVNNDRNVSLINGDFVCHPISATLIASKFPSLTQYADTICSVSIPPYPGYFSGYITFYVKGSPSASEVNDLRAAARKLSIATYDSDITK